MIRPQEHHCDLGLNPAADRTPDMRKAPTVAPVDANAHILNHQEKIMNTTKVAQTAPAANPIPLAEYQAELVESAKHYGLSFSIGDTDDGPLYVLRGIAGELVVRTYDIEEADRAIADYTPEPRTIGYVGGNRCGGEALRIQLLPSFAGDQALIVVHAGPDVRGPWRDGIELSAHEAGVLVGKLADAIVRLTEAE